MVQCVIQSKPQKTTSEGSAILARFREEVRTPKLIQHKQDSVHSLGSSMHCVHQTQLDQLTEHQEKAECRKIPSPGEQPIF